MERLTDPVKCRKITDKHLDYFDFEVEEWLGNCNNISFIEGDNVAFAEFKRNGVYWVHFCFDSAKGRKAIELTKSMYNKLFKEFPVNVIVGLILTENKKAKWLIRQTDFKSYGLVDTRIGLCEMFILTKDEI